MLMFGLFFVLYFVKLSVDNGLRAGYMVENLPRSTVIQFSLESSNFSPDIALHALHCEMMVIYSATARGQAWMYVALRANFKDL